MANTKIRRTDLDVYETVGERSRLLKEAYEVDGQMSFVEYVYGADITEYDFLKLVNIIENGK